MFDVKFLFLKRYIFRRQKRTAVAHKHASLFSVIKFNQKNEDSLEA